jgi:hypothetical protein
MSQKIELIIITNAVKTKKYSSIGQMPICKVIYGKDKKPTPIIPPEKTAIG